MNRIHPPRFLSSNVRYGKNNKLTSKKISDAILITTELWIEDPERVYIDAGVTTAKKGFRWITTWELNKHYLSTKIMDEKGGSVGTYWDITSPVKKNQESFEAYDWYLDIFVTADGVAHTLDEDELDLAVSQEYITNEEAKVAKGTLDELISLIAEK